MDDFEAGPESADEIGQYGSLLADAEGVPVTLEIIGMQRAGVGELALRTISLRCLPTPSAPPPPPVSEAAVLSVMRGYTELQSSTVAMLAGVTKALETVGNLTAKIVDDGAKREAAMRTELDAMRELLTDAIDTVRDVKATAAPASRAERLERLIVEMLGNKAERFATALLSSSDDEQADEKPSANDSTGEP